LWPEILQRREYNRPYVTDNPLPHGGTYLAVNAVVHAYPGVRLQGEFIGELRGISYGVNNTANMIAYPHAAFIFDSTFSVLGEPISLFLQVGDTVGMRFDEGLLFYNMDGQGTIISLGWNNLRFHLEHIGDAMAGIGLQINDVRQYALSISDIPIGWGWTVGARGSRINYLEWWRNPYNPQSPRGHLYDSIKPLNDAWSLSAALSNRDLRVYAQVGLRDSREPYDIIARGALLLGTSASGTLGNLEWSGRGEYRFYGGLFNAGFFDEDVRYRGSTDENTSQRFFGNTIGPFLYPLSNLERPFSQWAMFTEYQEMKDVMGLTAQLTLKYHLWSGIIARCVIDYNYVKPEQTEGFLYPFYDIGLGWEPAKNISVVASMTNRSMNLDKSYPTYYLRSAPAHAYTIRWNIP
jgi:hypothetical protein